MRKFKIIVLVHILILALASTFTFSAEGEGKSVPFAVSAQSAILIEQESGRVLYEKKANEVRRIASITKILTAILAIESGKMDEKVTVSTNAEGTEGSSLYLQAGEKIKLEDLVYGLMLRSGNDSAVAIAEHVGGSLEGFVFLMNQKAEELGMTNSVFANPHGLDDHEEHYSTAYDMAMLTRYAMQNDTFKKITGTKVHRAPNPNEKWDRVWKNKNKLVTGMYAHSTGGKTGYTKRAKRTLVSTASKDGLDVIAVTLNAPADWQDHKAMCDWGFNTFELNRLVKEGKVNDVDHEFYQDHVVVNRDFLYPLTKDEAKGVKTKVVLIKPKSEWSEQAPVDAVGRLKIYLDNNVIGDLPVYYKDRIPVREDSWFYMLKELLFSHVGVK